MLGERLIQWADERETQGRQEGESHALVTLIRHQVSAGLLSLDQAREQIQSLVASGEVPVAAGERALELLGPVGAMLRDVSWRLSGQSSGRSQLSQRRASRRARCRR